MAHNRYLCLYDIPIFSGMSRTSFQPICKAANKQSLEKGDLLFCQGDPTETIYIIKEGSFKLVSTTEAGEETILQIAVPGEILGETALFGKSNVQPATAIALEHAKVCSIDRLAFEKILRNEPDLALQVIQSLGNRLYKTWEQLVESNTQTIQEKVLSLLMRLAEEHGEPCPQGICIKISLTQQEISSLVGASRVRVSQVINELIEKDYLFKEKKHYILKGRCF